MRNIVEFLPVVVCVVVAMVADLCKLSNAKIIAVIAAAGRVHVTIEQNRQQCEYG